MAVIPPDRIESVAMDAVERFPKKTVGNRLLCEQGGLNLSVIHDVDTFELAAMRSKVDELKALTVEEKNRAIENRIFDEMKEQAKVEMNKARIHAACHNCDHAAIEMNVESEFLDASTSSLKRFVLRIKPEQSYCVIRDHCNPDMAVNPGKTAREYLDDKLEAFRLEIFGEKSHEEVLEQEEEAVEPAPTDPHFGDWS